MRFASTFPVALWALAAFPSGAATLSYDDARHLLNRTGFGATDAQIRRFTGMTRERAADTLLAETRTTAVTPAPAFTAAAGPLRYPRAGEDASADEKMQFRQEQVRDGLELRGWWIEEMIVTPSPLTERMTLFWHNHFVSAQQKVKLAVLMYRQNVTLRANALGNFGTMLHAIARDPAMVIYLDNARNRKGTPNENFAREAMELFTLGEGHYGESDIKEAARAFTGWSLDRDTGQFRFRPFLHDYGHKTVLGRSGNLDGDDVLDVLLAQPATAEFVTRKLWREFVSADPDEGEVKRIAARFRESRYDIKVALRALITSDAFYAAANRGTLVKSPVDLVVGTMRQLGMRPGETIPFAVATAAMGQNLFGPPNVKGWPGGEAWINSNTLLARKTFLDRLFRADAATGRMDSALAPPMSAGAAQMTEVLAVDAPAADPGAELARKIKFMRAMDRGLKSVHFDSEAWFATLKTPPEARAPAAERLLLAYAPQSEIDATAEPLAMVRQIVLDAAYQLK
ncbi:MAG TPA: DUF1800 domain-containing protein [Casimicrobiaceae bacterium]|nr:DUF1800 domain-containing protein [Casimicrobiaceae bacterium]